MTSAWRLSVLDEGAALVGREADDVAGEEPVDVEQLAAGLGMRAHDRVLDRWELGPDLVALLGRHLVTERRDVVVHRDEAVDARSNVVVETVVRGVHVGEERVATTRRHRDRVQHRGHRRHRAPADVAVPAILVAPDVGRLGEAHQLGELAVGRDERVHFEVAEPAREGDVLRGGDRLVAEEEDLVVEQGLAHLGDHRVGQVVTQRDAVDLGADGGAHRRRVERAPRQPGQALALRGQVPERADLVLELAQLHAGRRERGAGITGRGHRPIMARRRRRAQRSCDRAPAGAVPGGTSSGMSDSTPGVHDPPDRSRVSRVGFDGCETAGHECDR